ncbi:MAG: 2-oxoglutarate dehydrogenase E1 component [Chloroherpetonaceae bacterium]|nr:2-oxoglutarate dehydrogenase E1 component [Chthonomonadaceae bacterium]MDW8208178.1 2-oxoglutarate dehydrogenase E1 component [Chloroherpetonaceae bacterium]
MDLLSRFFGPNVGYVVDLYERYLRDPDVVDSATRAFFASLPRDVLDLLLSPVAGGSNGAVIAAERVIERPVWRSEDIRRIVATARLARFIREIGHMQARIDPLGSEPPGDPDLTLEAQGLTERDLEELPAYVVSSPLARGAANALEAIERLRSVYSGTVGYETDHIQVAAERDWLYEAIESQRFFQDFDAEGKRALLYRLVEVDVFEQFIHKTFRGAKRFSIEGNDMLVPMLDEIIRLASNAGTGEIVIGMAHRGRLNVLAHVMGKPYAAILSGFETTTQNLNASIEVSGRSIWSGDVKYHLGFQRNYQGKDETEMPLTLVPNPSHLEFVNPVVEGHTRAAQDVRDHRGAPIQDERAALAILIHGDAAFPGQGVVAETLNLSQLPGYRTGGTIHIIVNNQIGFTTLPSESRSTLYAGDLAKGFEIPIVHVNADDPLACLAVTRMAHAYRETFRKDFLIDLIGYRRYGHNEGDQPVFTQPRMYAIIEKHPRVREIWARRLEEERIIAPGEAETMAREVEQKLVAARKEVVTREPYDDMENATRSWRTHITTAVPADQLVAMNEALCSVPDGFTPNPTLLTRFLQKRRTALSGERAIDWGHAEALAFASILADGTPIRLTGQDSERGTFGQRNLVLHDAVTGARYCALQALPQARASFAVYNSPLSEAAVLGFEYGYSMHAPGVLVLWEAQFGDFVNGAQVIIDQFLVSGNAKWRQVPSLVLLLPHGYEGQGPEHSSARPERFLQLAATDNIRVANCTTASQYFHLLRRQAALLESDPRPLIIFTPKSLLRNINAAACLSDLTDGQFLSVIDDARASRDPDRVTRLIFCTGKVYMDLVYRDGASTQYRPEFEQAEGVAVVRVEELYPFPEEAISEVIQKYSRNLREIVWLQEEPSNMGAWSYIAPRLLGVDTGGWKGPLSYVGRSEAASPAEGSSARHAQEQQRIIAEALRDIPRVSTTRARVAQIR